MRKYELQDDGSRRQPCPVIRKKGDAYLMYCNVNGSTYGTDRDPKIMVSPGENYEGYTPIFQGDNAGPCQDAAAQMHHMNALDLSVFPAMSRHYINLARECGGHRVMKQDEIWNTAEL
eukprot:7889386-Ditylum_brightwellii.AAC.2